MAVVVAITTLGVAMNFGDRKGGSLDALIVIIGGVASFFGAKVGWRLTKSEKATAAVAVCRGIIVAALILCIAAAPFALVLVVGAFYALLLGVQMFGTQAFVVSIAWSLLHWRRFKAIHAEFETSPIYVRRRVWFWFWLAVGVVMLPVAMQASLFYAKFI